VGGAKVPSLTPIHTLVGGAKVPSFTLVHPLMGGAKVPSFTPVHTLVGGAKVPSFTPVHPPFLSGVDCLAQGHVDVGSLRSFLSITQCPWKNTHRQIIVL